MNAIVLADSIYSDFNQPSSYVGGLIGYLIVGFALGKVFQKADEPFWYGFVPILNAITLVRIVGFSAWAVLLYLIPIVGFIFHIAVAMRLGKAFAKPTFYSVVLLWLFSVIGYRMIGFDDSRYNRAAATA